MKSKDMKELFVMWKWKLLVTGITTAFFTLPIILNWDEVGFEMLILTYIIVPILTWITTTTGLYQYTKHFKEEDIKSRYAVKDINSELYSTIKVSSDEIVEIPYTKEVEFPASLYDDKTPDMETLSKDGPNHIGYIDFLDIKVPVYHDKYMDDNVDKAIAVWQARNPNAFYTGPVFMNWETGKMTYPDDVNPPEPKHEDYEMLPKFVAVGFEELTTENKTGILNYFAKEYMIRNKNWLEYGIQ
jgi:hypothetical protein